MSMHVTKYLTCNQTHKGASSPLDCNIYHTTCAAPCMEVDNQLKLVLLTLFEGLPPMLSEIHKGKFEVRRCTGHDWPGERDVGSQGMNSVGTRTLPFLIRGLQPMMVCHRNVRPRIFPSADS